MAFVRQRNKRDCGIAALSMLCNVTYEEVYRAIPWRREGILNGTSTRMLRIAAKRLGYEGHGTAEHQLKRMGSSINWQDIPDNSLVKIPGSRGWHWVVWRKDKVYDPAHGVFTPEKHGGIPTAYMQFTKEVNDG